MTAPMRSFSVSFLVLPIMIFLSSSCTLTTAWMGYSMTDNTHVRHQLLSTKNEVFRFKRRKQAIVSRAFPNGDDNNKNDEDIFPDATKVDFILALHKPLGCTVDESLAPEVNGVRHVFVSKVTEGGFAEAAGIRVGDVITGLSGLFGDRTNVGGLGLELVKGLVSSRPEDEPLWIRVARGTDVMERHEIALVNLCTSPDSNQKEMEQCVLDFIASGYSLDDNNINNDGEIDPATLASCSDTDTECLLDDLWSNWGEDPLPQPADFAVQEAASAAAAAAAKQKPKPWSSRSSPSGTYVRDPRTGKVRNIDA